jgi:hypothetical protein
MKAFLDIFKNPVERIVLFFVCFPVLLGGSMAAWNSYVSPHQELHGLMLTEDGEYKDIDAKRKAEAQGKQFWLHQVSEIEKKLNDATILELNVEAIEEKLQKNEARHYERREIRANRRAERRNRLIENGQAERVASASYKLEEEIEILEEEKSYAKIRERYQRLLKEAPIRRQKLEALKEKIVSDRIVIPNQ